MRQKSAKAISKGNQRKGIKQLQDNDPNNMEVDNIKKTPRPSTWDRLDLMRHSKVPSLSATAGLISKSALRRRKRRAREELKPKMDDLLSNLPTSNAPDDAHTVSSNTDEKDKSTQESSHTYLEAKSPRNLPNATKQSGYSRIMATEHKHFNSVLQNHQFKSSPFSALRDAISQNLDTK